MIGSSTSQPLKSKQELLTQRRCAYVLVLLGIVIVQVAYLRMLSQDVSDSLGVPLGLALLGLLIATFGFRTFADYQRRQKYVFSLTNLPRHHSHVVLREQPTEHWSTFSRN